MTRAAIIDARRDELLTVSEFARLIRCCEKTIYRLIWAGRLPGAYRVSGQWRIDLAVAMTPLSPSVQIHPIASGMSHTAS